MEDLKEKSISFWFRTALRIMAWAVLMFYMVFRIIMPLIDKDPLYLDKNDGYVMLGCGALILAVEAVKIGYERLISKKSDNI